MGLASKATKLIRRLGSVEEHTSVPGPTAVPQTSIKSTSRTKKLFYTLLAAGASIAQAQAQGCTNHKVSLEWDPVVDASLSGYILYWGTTSGVYNQSMDVGNVTEGTISNLTCGITYYFVVTAYNTYRLESEPSNEVNWMPVHIDPVKDLVLVSCFDFAGKKAAAVSWTQSASTNLATNSITYSCDTETNTINTAPITSITLSNLLADKLYLVSVRAVNDLSQQSPPKSVYAWTGEGSVPIPGTMTLGGTYNNIKFGQGSYTFTINHDATGSGAFVDSTIVRYGTQSGSLTNTLTVPRSGTSTQTSCTLSNLTPGTTYYIAIQESAGGVLSPSSAESSFSMPVTADKPSNVNFTSYRLPSDTNTFPVIVSWSPVTNAVNYAVYYGNSPNSITNPAYYSDAYHTNALVYAQQGSTTHCFVTSWTSAQNESLPSTTNSIFAPELPGSVNTRTWIVPPARNSTPGFSPTSDQLGVMTNVNNNTPVKSLSTPAVTQSQKQEGVGIRQIQ